MAKGEGEGKGRKRVVKQEPLRLDTLDPSKRLLIVVVSRSKVAISTPAIGHATRRKTGVSEATSCCCLYFSTTTTPPPPNLISEGSIFSLLVPEIKKSQFRDALAMEEEKGT